MKKIALGTVVFIFAGLIVLVQSVFILTEGQQAVITEFGKPIGNAITDAGVYFKTPFIQKVRRVDKRILNWDGFPNQIPTKDKKFISVDTTARWQIIDTLKFIQSVQNERGAKARLDSILDANTRDIISGHNLVEAVRDTDRILKRIADIKENANKQVDVDLVEEVTTDVEAISVGREKLSTMIAEKSDKELREFGIAIIDVQLRRISYEKSVERKVYERMIAERKRIAEKIRSIGKGKKAQIEGRLSKDLQEIESEAYQKAQIIKGRAEAESIKIYANSLKSAPDFYEFERTLEAYKKTIGKKNRFILSSDSEFFKLFGEIK